MFTYAIVKKPGKSFVKGLTTQNQGTPDYAEAIKQHESYVKALKKCSLEVVELPADENFPDSTFVEDTAVLVPEFAVVTNPGAPSRVGEIETMNDSLTYFYEKIYTIKASGTLEGGDVLQVNEHFFIGLSDR